MKTYLKLLRVKHYIKNLLVFAALACSGGLFTFPPYKFFSDLIGFGAFCAVSSAVYIINDIRDREKDRLHPTKRDRPIAAGTVSVRRAWFIMAILLLTAAVFNLLVFRWTSSALLLLYLVMNLAYSMGLKNIPILDITILAAGFLIRILYGAIITDITISNWLYLTVLALAIYFALGKRRNELKQLGDSGTRQVLTAYPVGFLDKGMGMCLTLANVFYALWSMDERTVTHYHSKYLIFTVPIVLLITLKYSLDIEGDSDGDPVEVLFRDRVLLLLCLLYLGVMFLILYL